LARLVVVPRSGAGFAEDASASQRVLAELGLPGFVRPDRGRENEVDSASTGRPHAPLLVHAASLPISASDLRRRARERRSLAYRLPESVAAYVREHSLYRDQR
jgi:nicotinic acid mononucleotide adenylyltransferase